MVSTALSDAEEDFRFGRLQRAIRAVYAPTAQVVVEGDSISAGTTERFTMIAIYLGQRLWRLISGRVCLCVT